VTTLVALAWLGDVLTGADPAPTLAALDRAIAPLAQYLARWEAHVDALCSRLEGIAHLVLVGRGPSLAAVGTGALIVAEAARFPAQGMSSGTFRHGPLEMASPEVFVLVYTGAAKTAELNARLAGDVRAAGGRAALVRASGETDPFALPGAPEVALPLLEILPAQMLSLALARMRGHEAGRFERASKVTTRE
jgi:glucosamine--fructose-6-phosphate aminotransferase (isomerizing)